MSAKKKAKVREDQPIDADTLPVGVEPGDPLPTAIDVERAIDQLDLLEEQLRDRGRYISAISLAQASRHLARFKRLIQATS